MKNEVTYHNKDVMSKVLAENFRNKPLSVYGLDVPLIKDVLPTNLPVVMANELRIDNLFLLEDGSVAIIDYESSYKREDKIKYLNYIVRVLERYRREGQPDIKLRMIVIYTADVTPGDIETVYDAGTLTFEIQPAFLSEIDSDEVRERLCRRVDSGCYLTDEELMEFIILPLTYKGMDGKRQALKAAIDMAKNITDDEQSLFVLSGILVFSDKIVDDELEKRAKEWIMMTKIARLFEEEKEQAVRSAVEDVVTQKNMEIEREKKKNAENSARLAEKDARIAELEALLAANQ